MCRRIGECISLELFHFVVSSTPVRTLISLSEPSLSVSLLRVTLPGFQGTSFWAQNKRTTTGGGERVARCGVSSLCPACTS